MSSHLTFKRRGGKLEEMGHLQIRRSCLLLAPKWLVCAGQGALSGMLMQSDQSEKAWLWCHSGPTSPGTVSVHRQLLPGLLLWQPSQSMKEAGGKCPCFVWQLSQLSVTCLKWRQGQQQNMVDLCSSGFRNSKHTSSPPYHAKWLKLSTGICATWVWKSPSRTGASSSHCGASAVMNSGSHPEHMMSRIHNSRHARQEWGLWSPNQLLIWHHLFCSHQGTLTKEMNVGRICPEYAVFPGFHISTNFSIRQCFSQRNPANMKWSCD
jgi:hypothetical protein